MVLIETLSFADLHLHKHYDLDENMLTTNVADLAEQITTIPAEEAVVLLLISGRSLTQTNEKVVFGYHLPWYDASDKEGRNHCLLFQLSPVHDVFRGYNAERPGFKIDENGSLVFGEKGNGVALVLERALKRMTVFHSVSSGDEIYSATSWRGDWQMDVQVEEIEMWLEL